MRTNVAFRSVLKQSIPGISGRPGISCLSLPSGNPRRQEACPPGMWSISVPTVLPPNRTGLKSSFPAMCPLSTERFREAKPRSMAFSPLRISPSRPFLSPPTMRAGTISIIRFPAPTSLHGRMVRAGAIAILLPWTGVSRCRGEVSRPHPFRWPTPWLNSAFSPESPSRRLISSKRTNPYPAWRGPLPCILAQRSLPGAAKDSPSPSAREERHFPRKSILPAARSTLTRCSPSNSPPRMAATFPAP